LFVGPRKFPKNAAVLRVLSRSAGSRQGRLAGAGLKVPCALGRAGRTALKREGDFASPRGRFALLGVFYRPERLRRPRTGLPIAVIRPDDGWCDAPADRNYNRPVRLPYPASAERMWRDDGLYDLVVVLDHNFASRRRNGGSAIFLHCAAPGYAPTAGCVALARRDLVKLLARLRPGTVIEIV
jgi:L,D-peptidoglycan transpeptidase YkuD (ErfK/YbiS/YcfS/YnhG family)